MTPVVSLVTLSEYHCRTHSDAVEYSPAGGSRMHGDGHVVEFLAVVCCSDVGKGLHVWFARDARHHRKTGCISIARAGVMTPHDHERPCYAPVAIVGFGKHHAWCNGCTRYSLYQLAAAALGVMLLAANVYDCGEVIYMHGGEGCLYNPYTRRFSWHRGRTCIAWLGKQPLCNYCSFTHLGTQSFAYPRS